MVPQWHPKIFVNRDLDAAKQLEDAVEQREDTAEQASRRMLAHPFDGPLPTQAGLHENKFKKEPDER